MDVVVTVSVEPLMLSVATDDDTIEHMLDNPVGYDCITYSPDCSVLLELVLVTTQRYTPASSVKVFVAVLIVFR